MINKKLLIKIVVPFIILRVGIVAYNKYTEYKLTAVDHSIKIGGDILKVDVMEAIDTYYAIEGSYPRYLNQLVPNYINELPLEPDTRLEYVYFIYKDEPLILTQAEWAGSSDEIKQAAPNTVHEQRNNVYKPAW